MRHLMRRRLRGLTLVELMVTLVIGALLLAAAAPFYGDYVTNSRLRENGNQLLTEALIAQSEAIKRNTTVRLATTATTIQVLDMTTPGTPVVLRERVTTGNVTLPVASVDFGTEGRPLPFGTSASIDLSGPVVCSADHRCPGLRIDAGGAVRLCGNYLSCSS